MQLAAGPFAAADLGRGNVARALNGIIPVFSARGERDAVGTHADMVAALAGDGTPSAAPPGTVTAIDGSVTDVAPSDVFESLPLMSLTGLEREVEQHVARAGPSQRVPWASELSSEAGSTLSLRLVRNSLVALPRLRTLEASRSPTTDLSRLRSEISKLWWSASLCSKSLFVPAFERPALDSLTLGMNVH